MKDEPAVLKYPETRRVNHTDDYHGVAVHDPYRWLEADVRESPEVAAWVEKQNEIARAYLDAIPQRPQIIRRLTELWNYERYSEPTEEGGRYFYQKNDGLQNQPVLYVADTYDGEGRVLSLEILVNTPAVANCIREGKTFMLPGIMQTGKSVGMKLMDDSLRALFEQGLITQEECMSRSEDKTLMKKYFEGVNK